MTVAVLGLAGCGDEGTSARGFAAGYAAAMQGLYDDQEAIAVATGRVRFTPRRGATILMHDANRHEAVALELAALSPPESAQDSLQKLIAGLRQTAEQDRDAAHNGTVSKHVYERTICCEQPQVDVAIRALAALGYTTPQIREAP